LPRCLAVYTFVCCLLALVTSCNKALDSSGGSFNKSKLEQQAATAPIAGTGPNVGKEVTDALGGDFVQAQSTGSFRLTIKSELTAGMTTVRVVSKDGKTTYLTADLKSGTGNGYSIVMNDDGGATLTMYPGYDKQSLPFVPGINDVVVSTANPSTRQVEHADQALVLDDFAAFGPAILSTGTGKVAQASDGSIAWGAVLRQPVVSGSGGVAGTVSTDINNILFQHDPAN